MSPSGTRSLDRLAVIGAGNMGSGIAQKMATEGFAVVLVDLDDEKVGRGMDTIKATLAEGVERKLFRPAQADEILARVRGTSDWQQLAEVDLAVEAVFEDLDVKRDVFRRLEASCRPDAILGTNTSSFSVSEIAESIERRERVVGLHYFYHPAKNRLVEVVPGAATDARVLRAAWALQERIGKTPIASSDTSGFVVNRFFVPWLNEAVRLVEEGVADVPTVEAACKKAFGVGMGPFELMNVTGIPIALHAATTLGRVFGAFYAPSAALATQVDGGGAWDLEGEPDASKFSAVDDRMLAVVFYVASALVDEGVSSVEDTDIGARVGLRWPRGPFEMINHAGVDRTATLVRGLAGRWELDVPKLLQDKVDAGEPFAFQLVRREIRDGVATLTINRPDAMNALNETIVAQLHEALRQAVADPEVRGVVIAGAGKAFIAGADIRFFVRNMDSGDIDRIVEFTEAGQALLNDIDQCPKPVVARLHGLALGGGLELALACDRLIAAPKAAFAFPETGIGIYPGLGGTQRAPRRIGAPLAKWLIYTGQMLGAREAAEIGLIDRTVSLDALDEAVHSEASGKKGDHDTIAGRPAMERLFGSHTVAAVREGKIDAADDKAVARAIKQVGFKAPLALELAEKLIDGGAEIELDAGLQLELDQLRKIFSTEDAYEGLTSLGKRRPAFNGR